MKAKSAMAAAIISMFCLAAEPVVAHEAGSHCRVASQVTRPLTGIPYSQGLVAPGFFIPHYYSPKRFASAFSAAYAAAPIAILKSRKGGSTIVQSDVPVNACVTGARAAFALNSSGDVVYGCETSQDDHFSVCWKGYGCHRYQISKWDTVALTRAAKAATPSHQ